MDSSLTAFIRRCKKKTRQFEYFGIKMQINSSALIFWIRTANFLVQTQRTSIKLLLLKQQVDSLTFFTSSLLFRIDVR